MGPWSCSSNRLCSSPTINSTRSASAIGICASSGRPKEGCRPYRPRDGKPATATPRSSIGYGAGPRRHRPERGLVHGPTAGRGGPPAIEARTSGLGGNSRAAETTPRDAAILWREYPAPCPARLPACPRSPVRDGATVDGHDCLFGSAAVHSYRASTRHFAYREPCGLQAGATQPCGAMPRFRWLAASGTAELHLPDAERREGSSALSHFRCTPRRVFALHRAFFAFALQESNLRQSTYQVEALPTELNASTHGVRVSVASSSLGRRNTTRRMSFAYRLLNRR